MRKYAKETEIGKAHLIAAAVAMTAFSFEAFVQTLGPDAYGDEWSQHPRPAERLPVRVKLKRIGKRFGLPVSLGIAPWRDLSLIIDARDRAAHPSPEIVRVREIVFAEDPSAALQRARDQVFAKVNPMHDIDRLDAASNQIEAGLVEIWVASGRKRHALKGWHQALWSVSPAE